MEPLSRVKYLYRYRSFQRKSEIEDLFVEGEMYAASPVDFNDPFEWNPFIEDSCTEKQKRRFIQEVIKYNNPKISNKRLKMASIHPNVVLAYDQHAQKLITAVKEAHRIHSSMICFSEVSDSLLMWSHYADSHKGVCIQFRFDKLADVFPLLYPVSYSDSYPIVNVLDLVRKSDEYLFQKTSLIKSVAWSYEKEYRALFPKRKAGPVKFDVTSISAIIVGCRSSAETKKAIENSVNSINQDVAIVRAATHPSRYRVLLPGLPT